MTIGKPSASAEQIIDRCLSAFVEFGRLDVSLDQLAARVCISKRMLVHYFGGRDAIEEQAMTRLEQKLRAQFSPNKFPSRVSAKTIVTALWERTTSAEAKGVLLLTMDLSRRAWNGSARAKSFYTEQQRLWVELLTRYIHDQAKVEELLQLFQGAVLAFLITGNREPGKRSLLRVLSRRKSR
jgi:AcrR family transcriptional regulator